MLVSPPPQSNNASLKDLRNAFYASTSAMSLIGSLFDNVPGAFFFVKDRESRFVDGSLSFARIMGESDIEGLIGKTDYDYSPDFLAEAFIADDRRVMVSGEPIYNRIELVPSWDGALDWLCTSKVPLHDHSGAVVGLAGVARMIRDSDSLYAEHPEMHRIVDFVRHHFREKISVADMAAHAGLSLSSQERLFKRIFGRSPLMYLRKTRLHAACKLLRETEMSLSSIAAECGFSDQAKMTRAFRAELKITPLRYRHRFGRGSDQRGVQSRGESIFLLSAVSADRL